MMFVFSVYTACHHVYLLHYQEWPTIFNCTNLFTSTVNNVTSFKPVTIVLTSAWVFSLVYLFISVSTVCYLLLIYYIGSATFSDTWTRCETIF